MPTVVSEILPTVVSEILPTVVSKTRPTVVLEILPTAVSSSKYDKFCLFSFLFICYVFFMKNYVPRIIDSLIDLKLSAKGAVVIEGAKWCGKTTSAKQVAKSVILMNDPGRKSYYNEVMQIDPGILLKGDTPRLIDEWQMYPDLWDAVRFAVDERSEFSQFILTGSVTPVSRKKDWNKYHHSGAGRFSWITMRPMTLFESGDSNGKVSLEALFAGETEISGENPCADIHNLAWLICRGGWPMACRKDISKKIALMQAPEYVDAIGRSDMDTEEAEKTILNKRLLQMFLRSFSRNIGSQIPIKDIAKDCVIDNISTMSDETAYNYYSILSSWFVIEDMSAWNPNLRSKIAIRTSPTHYFVDPSIATASLGLGPDDLIGDLQSYGFWFENLCVRDLRVYSQAINGEIYHYRDKSNLECDAVIHLKNGSYALAGIKLGAHSAVDQGAETLKKLATKIDTDKMKKPSFLMVITGTAPFAYRRNDGVFVVPITCLKP